MNYVETNLAICRALGIFDTTDVTRVELVLEAGDLPVIHIYRSITDLGSSTVKLELLREFCLTPRARISDLPAGYEKK